MYSYDCSSLSCTCKYSPHRESLRRFSSSDSILLPRCYYQRSYTMDHGLPYMPKFEEHRLCQGRVFVVWFEMPFSQTYYNESGSNSVSNACTLIAILLTAYCYNEYVFVMCSHNCICNRIIQALGIAMLNGNKIYNRFKQLGRLPNVNLSVPEAIMCAGNLVRNIMEWRSILFMQPMTKTLYENLQINLKDWNATDLAQRHNYLFVILISDSRSVTFIINQEEKTITFVDSHVHSPTKGAVIAVVHKKNLSCLCNWFVQTWYKYNHSYPMLYELSFLYYRRK